jgi:hypothetical protein
MAEGFSCILDVLNADLGRNVLQCLIKNFFATSKILKFAPLPAITSI